MASHPLVIMEDADDGLKAGQPARLELCVRSGWPGVIATGVATLMPTLKIPFCSPAFPVYVARGLVALDKILSSPQLDNPSRDAGSRCR